MDPETSHIYIQCGRTGGNALNVAISHIFPFNELSYKYGSAERNVPDLTVLTEKLKSDFKPVVLGHLPFGIHRELDRPYRYFASFREPISRILSSFHAWSPNLTSADISKEELNDLICQYIEDSFDCSNGMTKMIRGYHFDNKRNIAFDFLKNQEISNDIEVTEDDYKIALGHLKNEVGCVLIQGYHAVNSVLTQEFLDCAPLYSVTFQGYNRRKFRLDRKFISESTMKMIRERNHWDFKLYDEAFKIFTLEKERLQRDHPEYLELIAMIDGICTSPDGASAMPVAVFEHRLVMATNLLLQKKRRDLVVGLCLLLAIRPEYRRAFQARIREILMKIGTPEDLKSFDELENGKREVSTFRDSLEVFQASSAFKSDRHLNA
ncbi:MAG: hypothetical protein COV44_11875 [Deltaproteobacteria bacterium CG11_big_fil_rev_8_21_14_0_20_45_16]|nr:MAG: hypothetical protein COV44_11875 [Deltaproteobacteria bacterium CG11_big_fil_rev_8_21_14_0_20_45_16]